VEKYCRAGQGQMTTWRMRIACWITKVTYTHSENVILIGFQLQQWLRESALMLRVVWYLAHILKYGWLWATVVGKCYNAARTINIIISSSSSSSTSTRSSSLTDGNIISSAAVAVIQHYDYCQRSQC